MLFGGAITLQLTTGVNVCITVEPVAGDTGTLQLSVCQIILISSPGIHSFSQTNLVLCHQLLELFRGKSLLAGN